METLHKKQSMLLQKLLEETKTVTSNQLSLLIGVSVRTIKTYIQEINEKVAPFGVHIASKAREGYWIERDQHANMEAILSMLDKQVVQRYDEPPKYNYERINYIIKKLLVIDYHIKLEDLMDEIFISRSTLSADLKEVRKLLAKFRLKVITRANYGIIIEGSEIDKRLCICEYFFHFNEKANYTIDSENMFNTGKNKEEYDVIIQYIKDICEAYHLMLSDFSINNLAIHASVAMRRCTFYDYVKVENEMILRYHNKVEFRAADAFVKKLEQKFHCMLPVGETIYYAMHLESKRIFEENHLQDNERKRLEDCIHIILEEVKNNFELNLDDNLELNRYLYVHLPQMIQRLRNHMVIRNPLVYDNLRRYLFATKVTHSAVAVIEQMYDVKVDINEFGYLLLYFNMAIMKAAHRKKIKIGFVSGRGRPESIMYFNEISEHFSHDKYEVMEISKENLLQQIQSIDLLVTTYMLNMELPMPVYLIRNDTYLEEIRMELSQLQYKTLRLETYFKQEYCVFELPGSTREEVMRHFYQVCYERGYLKRLPNEESNLKDDELGNGIVHFQDLYRICRREMCFIAVLKHPVLWNRDIVRVLILTKTKKDGDKDLPALCHIVSRWANRMDKVEHLVASQSFTSFYQDIKEA